VEEQNTGISPEGVLLGDQCSGYRFFRWGWGFVERIGGDRNSPQFGQRVGFSEPSGQDLDLRMDAPGIMEGKQVRNGGGNIEKVWGLGRPTCGAKGAPRQIGLGEGVSLGGKHDEGRSFRTKTSKNSEAKRTKKHSSWKGWSKIGPFPRRV